MFSVNKVKSISYFKIFFWHTIKIVAVIFLVMFLGKMLIVDRGQVRGVSMEPNYKDSEFFWISRSSYLFRQPKRYEVVSLSIPSSGDLAIKRIVGLPGETIMWQGSDVWLVGVDGEKEKIKAFSFYGQPQESEEEKTVMLKDDEYFVLGDNRLISGDSRAFGSVHRRFILGKVF